MRCAARCGRTSRGKTSDGGCRRRYPCGRLVTDQGFPALEGGRGSPGCGYCGRQSDLCTVDLLGRNHLPGREGPLTRRYSSDSYQRTGWPQRSVRSETVGPKCRRCIAISPESRGGRFARPHRGRNCSGPGPGVGKPGWPHSRFPSSDDLVSPHADLLINCRKNPSHSFG